MYVAVNVAAGHAVARVDVPEHIAALHAVARVYVPRDGRVRAADDGELALDVERRAVIPKIHVHALARPARKRRMTYELMADEEHGVQHRFLVAPREIVVNNGRLRRGWRGKRRRAHARAAEERVHAHAEILRDLRQHQNVRAGKPVFPLAHRLRAHAELCGERVLRETLFAPQRGDRRSDNVLFHCMNLQKAFYPDEPRIGAPG